ncbi:MAG: RAMP superfamily CRISPR-associated protein [Caldilineaceae bacterium]
MNKADLAKSRKIIERIVVTGELVLETPTRFGNGDEEGLIDMTLARDSLEGHALLPGASIAGALRSYLRTRELGFRTPAARDALERRLFGIEERRQVNGKQEIDSDQSYLIVYDALAKEVATELRDGVAIDPLTRTARHQKKFDLELLAAGTRFPLRVELLVGAGQEEQLVRALAIALQGFERGEIPMGARRRRGFGQCRVTEWQVKRYPLIRPQGLLAWLTQDQAHPPTVPQKGTAIGKLLNVAATDLDKRQIFTIEATLGVAGSLLIRSYSEEPGAPDMVHLKSKRNGNHLPIISGTSLAGALRARALRIANTIGESSKAATFIDDLFGPQIENSDTQPWASRLWAEESVIEQPLDLVVNRVKIDRFTGGSFPTALFSEQPVFGMKETQVTLTVHIHNPTNADKGILLLLLKDLWTQDLPVGGEASVGRGRLQGKYATLVDKQDGRQIEWELRQEGTKLVINGDRNLLQTYVDQFWEKVQA